MIVPHSERPPISLRIPPRVTPLVLVILAALLVLAVSFASSYYRLQNQLEDLQREREMGASRQREMRTTILSQQDEVRNLATEVEQLEADLMQIERISKKIRELIGVEEPDLTSTPESSSFRVDEPFDPSTGLRAGPTQDGQSSRKMAVTTGLGGGSPYQPIDYSPSNRPMAIVATASQHVQNIGVLLPVTLQEQQILRKQVLKRLEKIEPIKRHDPEALAACIKLCGLSSSSSSLRISSRLVFSLPLPILYISPGWPF